MGTQEVLNVASNTCEIFVCKYTLYLTLICVILEINLGDVLVSTGVLRVLLRSSDDVIINVN